MNKRDSVDYRPQLNPNFEKQARINNAARVKEREQKTQRNLNAEDKNLIFFNSITNEIVIRELEKLGEFCRLTMDRLWKIIFDPCLKNGICPSPYARIERRICAAFHVSPAEIRSHRKNKHIVFARQAVMYWTVRLTGFSYPEIGKLMGGRDHTTIMHGAKAYCQKRKKMGRYLRKAY